MAQYKICFVCGKTKTLDQFPIRSDSHKHRNECKKCTAIYKADHYIKNREEIRKKQNSKYIKTRIVVNKVTKRQSTLKTTFGIYHGYYDDLLLMQKFKCKICGSKKANSKNNKYFHIDHDHSNGYIRGLLCNKCNTLLGFANENTEILKGAITYLNKYQNIGGTYAGFR